MHLIADNHLKKILIDAESQLFTSMKYKFEKGAAWRNKNVPDKPGIYALFEGNRKLIYIGETGNLRARMNDLCRTVNHTFRKNLGASNFGGIKTTKKFSDEVERKLDLFYDEKLYVSFLVVNYGRLEIESYLISKYQRQLMNSEKKRM